MFRNRTKGADVSVVVPLCWSKVIPVRFPSVPVRNKEVDVQWPRGCSSLLSFVNGVVSVSVEKKDLVACLSPFCESAKKRSALPWLNPSVTVTDQRKLFISLVQGHAQGRAGRIEQRLLIKDRYVRRFNYFDQLGSARLLSSMHRYHPCTLGNSVKVQSILSLSIILPVSNGD